MLNIQMYVFKCYLAKTQVAHMGPNQMLNLQIVRLANGQLGHMLPNQMLIKC